MSTAVIEKPRQEPPVTNAGNAVTMLDVIERVVRDPCIDIAKMQQLLEMQERITARNAKAAYDAAMSEMQPQLPVIAERGKIDIGRGKPQSYAKWDDINEAIKPVLARHGFALSFRTGRQDDRIVVTGILSHREGHREETTMQLPLDTSGSKNNVQAVGSSTSYGKRYTAAALLNLTSRGEDDDGRTAGGTLAPDQIERVRSLIVEVAASIPLFCKYMKVERIEDIPAREFDRAVRALESKRAPK